MLSPTYEFERYRVDPQTRELHCGGELLDLSPKVFDCLAYLIEHRDRAVGRDELIAAVWGRAEVSDTLLGQTVLKARRAVGDTGSEQSLIRTIPRFGYRWVGAVVVTESAASIPPTRPAVELPVAAPMLDDTSPALAVVPSPHTPSGADSKPVTPAPAPLVPRHRNAWSGARGVAVLALALAALGLGVYLRHDTVPQEKPRLAHAATPEAASDSPVQIEAAAVLPVDIAATGEWSWLRLGLMDLVASRLRQGGLTVVPSDNVVALARQGEVAETTAHIRQATGARYVIRSQAESTVRGWVVRLVLDTRDGSERGVEAHAPEAVAAGREAADRLLVLMGLQRDPVDAGSDLPTAELWSRVDAAVLTDDLATARRLLDAAPESLRKTPERNLRLGQLQFRAGQLDAARRTFTSMLDETGPESRPVLRARALNGLGVIAIRGGRFADAETAYTEAIDLLDRQNRPELSGQAFTGRAVAYAARGRFDPARADFSRARIALERAGDQLALARLNVNEAVVSATQGRYSETVPSYQRAAEQFERFGALNELVDTLGNSAEAQLLLLRPCEALASTERALPYLARLENPNSRHLLQIQRANALAGCGQTANAAALLASFEDGHPDHSAVVAAKADLARAQLEFAAGRFEAAAGHAEHATTDLNAADQLRDRATAWLLWKRSLRALGRDAEAAQQAEAMARWGNPGQLPPLRAFARLAEAEQLWTRRDEAQAQAAYEDALRIAAEVDVPADLVEVAISYTSSLLSERNLERAGGVVGLAGRWADHDFRSALLQVRYYRALGERTSWESALRRARALAGDRPIPAPLDRFEVDPVAGAGLDREAPGNQSP